MEYIAVDIACKETNSEEYSPQKSANYIDAPSSLPVMCPKTAVSLYCVSMSAGHVMGKPALIDIDNSSAILFVFFNLF
jgi:hypothetical protein